MNSGRKTILQVNSVCRGSTGRMMCSLRDAARARGYHSFCAYGIGDAPDGDGFIPIGRTDMYHVRLTWLWSRLTGRHGVYSGGATKRFLQQVDVIDPGIIHLHNIHGNYIDIRRLFEYIKDRNVGTVWTLHDCWAFTGYCAHFVSVGCEQWKTACQKCPPPVKRQYPKTYFFDRSKSSFELKKRLFSDVPNLTIVAPSGWLAEQVQQSFLGCYPTKVIHYGLDVRVFRPVDGAAAKSALGISPETFVLLGVADNFGNRQKGFQYFVELSQMLGSDMIIVLVGASPKQIRTLPPNVIGLERTEDLQQLAAYYSMADVFVNPTLEEAFSVVTAEALACGTPVVAFDTGPLPEVVGNECGIIVPAGDVDALHRAIIAIKQRGKSEYAEICVSRAREKYDSHKQFAQYIELYEEMLAKGE